MPDIGLGVTDLDKLEDETNLNGMGANPMAHHLNRNGLCPI